MSGQWTSVCTQIRAEGNGQFIRVEHGQFTVEGGTGRLSTGELIVCIQVKAEDGQFSLIDGQFNLEDGQFRSEGSQLDGGQFSLEGGQFRPEGGQFRPEGGQFRPEGSQLDNGQFD